MKTVECSADMGAIKIGFNGFYTMFSNGFGDGSFDVHIADEIEDEFDTEDWKFVTSFEVHGLDGVAHLYDYDCGGEVVYTFSQGRYGVYNKEGNVGIVFWDELGCED